jgi:hypothetical protein
MKKNILILLLLAVIFAVPVSGQAPNANTARIIDFWIDPAFPSPTQGTQATFNITLAFNQNQHNRQPVFLTVVAAPRGSAINNAQWAVNLSTSGAPPLVPFSNVANTAAYHIPNGQFVWNETRTFQFNFTVPDNFRGLWDFFVITSARNPYNAPPAGFNNNVNMVNPYFNATNAFFNRSNAKTFDFTGTRHVIYNTAFVGIKSSTATLTIIDTPELSDAYVDVILIPQERSANYPQAQPFGFSQEIEIRFDAGDGDTLWYSIGVDSLSIQQLQSSQMPQTTITPTVVGINANANTFFVSVYVAGGTNEPTYRVWRFVREELPELIITPAGRPEAYRFSESVAVNARINNLNVANLLNFGIWYTTDGSAPIDNDGPTANAELLTRNASGDITFTQTTQMRIAAWADDRLPTEIQTHNYRRIADGTDAFFFDTNGDGEIDRVVIRTTIPVVNPPENVQLTSPWNSAVVVNTSANPNIAIERINERTIVVRTTAQNNIFPSPNYASEIRTSFDANRQGLGRLFGAEYNENSAFAIGDSIAPIAVLARFDFGAIDVEHYTQTGEIVRDYDMLRITFSEPTHVDRILGYNIFNFYRAGNESEDIRRFQLNLELVEQNATMTTATFRVLSDQSAQRPIIGDSLSVVNEAIRESGNHSVLQLNETRRILLSIGHPPYLLVITPISSFVAGHEPIGLDIVSGAALPVALVDFLVPIREPDIDKLNIRGRIIDPLGNLVADFNGFETDRHNPRTSSIFALRYTGGSPETTRFLVFWNAQNTLGRRVGAGTYLAIFDITTPDGNTQTETVIIPIGATGR